MFKIFISFKNPINLFRLLVSGFLLLLANSFKFNKIKEAVLEKKIS